MLQFGRVGLLVWFFGGNFLKCFNWSGFSLIWFWISLLFYLWGRGRFCESSVFLKSISFHSCGTLTPAGLTHLCDSTFLFSLWGQHKSIFHIRNKDAGRKKTCDWIPSLHWFWWERANILHSSSPGAVFWICAGNSTDRACFTCSGAVLTQPRGLLPFPPCPTVSSSGAWEGTQRDCWPQLATGMFQTMWHHTQQ